MQTTNQPVLLTREDHAHIQFYLRNQQGLKVPDRQSATLLQQELNRAQLIENDKLPEGVVRIGSKVKVRELTSNKILDLIIETPGNANVKERKISVLSPLGTALIGYSSGATVKWEMPAGVKFFFIENVNNHGK